jgi:hypothetical protein
LAQAAQVEEELALRLGGCNLHDAPVAQDELMDFSPDPVHGKRHQTHSAFGIEALDRLHEADIAFLNEVRLRQAISEITTRDGHHDSQV